MSVNAKQNGSLKKLANFGMDALETIITKLFKNADEQSFPMPSDSAEGINLLKNVEIDTPTNGQVLKYDATNGVWVNGQGGSTYTAQADVIADTMADLTENKTATVTDGVADFETIDGSLVKSLVVEIEPSQSGSGTPSPDNIRPITGWTQEDVFVVGKNRFLASVNVGYNINANGAYVASSDRSATEDFIPIKPSTTYTLSYVNSDNEYNGIFFYDRGKNFISFMSWGANPRTFTSVVNAYYVRFAFKTINPVTNAQLELGSTATAYEPYIGKTYTIPFGQTVYGGTLDVLTGELTIDRGYLDASSVTWTAQTNSRWFYNGLTAVIKIPPNNATPTETISDRFSAMSNNDMASTTNIGLSVNGSGSLVIRNGSTTVQPEGQIVYPLATPTTLSLTTQTVKALVGENHIQASTGDVLECKYSMLINGDDLEMLLS